MPTRLLQAIALLITAVLLTGCSQFVGDNRHNVPLPKPLVDQMTAMGSSPAEPMMVRVFKETSELEVWKRTSGGQYALLKTYPICKWSGALGPKIQEGDHQSPEGFYNVTPSLMNRSRTTSCPSTSASPTPSTRPGAAPAPTS